jgi:hypothetical protein
MISFGVTFPFSDNAHFDLFYKRLSLGEVKTSGKAYLDYLHYFVVDNDLGDADFTLNNGTEFGYQDAPLMELKEEGYTESGEIVINEIGGAVRVFF